MERDWSDLTEIEMRATALDRLDLHFEHQDALQVERGSWRLTDHLRRFSRLEVQIGGRTWSEPLLAVGDDWVALETAVIRVSACVRIRPLGTGASIESVPISFRQQVRQMAGRIPRELVDVTGDSQVVMIDWVAADFLQARVAGAATLVPLGQVAGVLGRFDLVTG
ncbi:MAG: hypothetical protein R2720_13200 [Candidatus Nanopelagicales bacterium]